MNILHRQSCTELAEEAVIRRLGCTCDLGHLPYDKALEKLLAETKAVAVHIPIFPPAA